MFNKPTSAVTGKSFGNIANGPQTARNSYENRGKDLQWPVKPEELQCHLATLQKAKAGQKLIWQLSKGTVLPSLEFDNKARIAQGLVFSLATQQKQQSG